MGPGQERQVAAARVAMLRDLVAHVALCCDAARELAEGGLGEVRSLLSPLWDF